jgi:ubiquinone/menaquinone biosynthesis C-methylase UbiE
MIPSGTRTWEVFDRHAVAYDRWFAAHREVYEDEITLLRLLLPSFEHGVEIGAGTGRSAVPLGVRLGLEPSPSMARMAQERGVEVVRGVAEHLPFRGESFDLVLVVTAICFFCDVSLALDEARRVLMPGGSLLVAFIDREGELGKRYAAERRTSRFMRDARFVSEDEARAMLEAAGFRVQSRGELENGFVVCRAEKM